MTNTKPAETTNEICTVVVDEEKQTARVTTPKSKAAYIVEKPRAAMFFQIMTDKGACPKSLSGKYRSLQSAIEGIKQYLRDAPETFAVKSDRLAEYRNAKNQSENG